MELETDILDHRQLYAADAGPKVSVCVCVHHSAT